MTLGSLLVPYPQYGSITQTNTNGTTDQDAHDRAARAAAVHATASASSSAYAYNHEQRQEWFDDIAHYQVLHDRRRRRLGMAADRHAGATASPRP